VASDNELIARFLGGERAAFDELVLRYREQVCATAYRMVGNAETAEEIAQEAFIRVFRGLGKFRKKANFTTWLYRITMNLCYDEYSRRKKAAELNPQAEGATAQATAEAPSEMLSDNERKQWLECQIETLPFKQRSTIMLRIFRGMSFKEIGRALGCSAGSARVNYRHAVLKLKDAVASSGEEL
jgi:RNA polymerase sigma-70 factor (ECF subfamily)